VQPGAQGLEEQASEILKGKTLRALGAEFVLLNLYCGAALLETCDTPSGYQLQLALVVQLSGPTDRKFEPLAGNEYLVGCEQHTVAANVDRLAGTFFVAVSLVEYPVPDLSFNRKPIGIAPLGIILSAPRRLIWQQHGPSSIERMPVLFNYINRSKPLRKVPNWYLSLTT
jgi:hypothetical protein